VLGKYGKTPAPVDPGLLKLVIERAKSEPIQGRPADSLDPRMDSLKGELRKKGLPATDEVAVLYAMFPMETENVVRRSASASAPASVKPADVPPQSAPTSRHAPRQGVREMTLTVNGVTKRVDVEKL
jgi:pyruvate/oxaloacetate carboxyltransferase